VQKKSFKKIIIYYFSGTGNARSVAAWIKSKAETENVETEIIDIVLQPYTWI
jgi:flavodoxin